MLELLGTCSRSDRERVFRFLESLEIDPFQTGDYELRDADQRPHQVRIVSMLAVVYWADHAAREVKVTATRNADR
ncbi:MAG TPA: hypothetical protein DCY13_19910 [Verrucomicrobiales bacterium]|nr:hypothetical protein [Verrucomicrobiales bacterium]